ncbi:MAG: hypothetical protein Kow00129_08350 [Thermoleophilia bacterium]
MKVLYIAATSIRRLFRERSNLFFVFILPMLLILVLGSAFGGQTDPRVGVSYGGAGRLGDELVAALRQSGGLVVVEEEDRDDLILAVERGRLEAGVVIPPGYDEELRAGGRVTVEFVSRPEQSARAVGNTIEAIVARQASLLRAAKFAAQTTGVPFSEALEQGERLTEEIPRFEVRQETVGEPFLLDRLGRFDLGAYSQLILFVFLTSMTGSSALIQSRQLGISRRMFSTPTPVRSILAGEALGRFAVALLQGGFIMLGSAVIFGVGWGNPGGALAVLLIFSFGAAATGMLLGAVFKNDQQAAGLGVIVGLGLAALGGCMVPLSIMEVFSPTLWRVAHVTPHAWGIEAFEELILRDGSLLDIWMELGVLSAFAAAMFALATWRLRAALTAG